MGMGHRAAPHFADRDQCLKGNRIVSCTVRITTLRTDFQVSVLFRNPHQSERTNPLGHGVRNRHKHVQASTSHSLVESSLSSATWLSGFTAQLLHFLSPQQALRHSKRALCSVCILLLPVSVEHISAQGIQFTPP